MVKYSNSVTDGEKKVGCRTMVKLQRAMAITLAFLNLSRCIWQRMVNVTPAICCKAWSCDSVETEMQYCRIFCGRTKCLGSVVAAFLSPARPAPLAFPSMVSMCVSTALQALSFLVSEPLALLNTTEDLKNLWLTWFYLLIFTLWSMQTEGLMA